MQSHQNQRQLGPAEQHRDLTAFANGTPHGGSVDTSLDLASIIATLWRGKWAIVSILLISAMLAGVYSILAPPVYESTSFVSINMRGALLPGVEITLEEKPSVATEIGMLQRSSALALAVAQKLDQTSDALGTDEFYPTLSGKGQIGWAGIWSRFTGGDNDADSVFVASVDQEDRLLAISRQIQERMMFNPLSTENMIGIRAESSSPEEAAQLANLYAEEYKRISRERSRASLVAARTFLQEQIDLKESEMAAVESQWEQFSNSRNLVAIGAGGERVLEEYWSLTTRKEGLQFQLRKEQMQLDLLQQELNDIRPNISVGATESIRRELGNEVDRIFELRSEIDQWYFNNPALKDNPSREPQLVAKLDELRRREARKAELEQKLIDETLARGGDVEGGQLGYAALRRSRILEKEGLIREYGAEIAQINERLSLLQQNIRRIPRQTFEVEQINRRRDLLNDFYSTFLAELQKIQIAEQAELGYVDVVRSAVTPLDPVRPDPLRNMLFALLVGGFVGFGAVLVRSVVADKLRTPDDLRQLGFSVAGTVPPMDQEIKALFKGRDTVEVGGLMRSTRLMTLHDPWSPIAEHYRLIRTNLEFAGPDAPQVVLVTSPESSDGKSVTAVNLAVAMAGHGKRTLLVDGDLRRPSLHTLLGLENTAGLSQMLDDSDWVSQPLSDFATDIQRLFFVPAGKAVKPPSELIGSRSMYQFVKHMRNAVDMIVIDSPPVLAATDAVILGDLCDAALMVVSANRTTPRALQVAASILERVGVPIKGIVFNRFDAKRGSGYYGFNYDYKYYHGSAS